MSPLDLRPNRSYLTPTGRRVQLVVRPQGAQSWGGVFTFRYVDEQALRTATAELLSLTPANVKLLREAH